MAKEEESKKSPPAHSALPGMTGQLMQRELLAAPVQPGHLASLGLYDIVGDLGKGGMGVVLSAIDSRNGSRVAIKLLRPDLAGYPQLVHRFLREARHMQKLRHPNILPVLDVSQDSTTAYFVMPLMENGSLDRQFSEESPMAEEDVIAIGRQIASALSHAHTKGLIHRDLKPGNVLLDKSGRAFLGDFGLARTLVSPTIPEPERGDTGEGTAPYMSPQLARGEVEDTRCDIYAFGALLYEMLTGRPPYEGEVAAQILEQIKRSAPAPILKWRPRLSPRLVTIVEGAMARELRDRYASMADVLADLERLEKGLAPVGPHTTFSWQRLARGRRRELLTVGCGCTVLAAALLAFNRPQSGTVLEKQWTHQTPDVFTWADAILGDWDGDGLNDILKVSGEKLHVLANDGQPCPPAALEKPAAHGFCVGLLADINGDGLEDPFIRWSQGSNAHITVLNQKSWPIREFVFPGTMGVHPHWGTNQTMLIPLRITDLEGDNQQELLASVGSSWTLRPRGICCFDVASGKTNWFFETSNFVLGVEVIDLDGDGRQEIIVGGNAPGNYPDEMKLPDGTDDGHAYVYALSSDGKLKWSRELAGVFGAIRPLHRATTNKTALVWVTTAHAYTVRRGEPDMGRILEFDAHGNLLREHDFKVQLTSALAADLDGDGREELLAGDRLGRLHVLDGGLNELKYVIVAPPAFDEVDLQLVEFSALGSSGVRHLIATTSQMERRTEPYPGNSREQYETVFYHDNRVTVLDGTLRPVASHLVSKRWNDSNIPGLKAVVAKGRPGEPYELLVLSDAVERLALKKGKREWQTKGLATATR